MKRRLFLTGIVGVLLLLGMVFAVTGCDNGSGGGGYKYSFVNSSSYTVTVNIADLAEFTIASGKTTIMQLPYPDIDYLDISYSPANYVGYRVSSSLVTGTTVTFYNKYSY
jgi:hypothetical protein